MSARLQFCFQHVDPRNVEVAAPRSERVQAFEFPAVYAVFQDTCRRTGRAEDADGFPLKVQCQFVSRLCGFQHRYVHKTAPFLVAVVRMPGGDIRPAFVQRGRIQVDEVSPVITEGVERLFRNVVRADALSLPATAEKFDVLFMDAPYRRGLTEPALKAAAALLRPGALCLIEVEKNESCSLPETYRLLDERRYGLAKVLIAEFIS